MDIDIFDFDKTIYARDCTADFYIYCIKRRPAIVLLWPVLVIYIFLLVLHVISLETFKSALFMYFRFLGKGTIEALIKAFWDIHRKNLNFTAEFMQRYTVVISASPEALVKEGCRNIGVDDVIGTKLDLRTGKVIGKNCRGVEKTTRLFEKYADVVIIRTFSDSVKADKPILELAKEPYIVRKSVVSVWQKER